MTTYSALTTVGGEAVATALGAAMERLHPAPYGIGTFEIEDGRGRWEVGGYFPAPPDQAGLALLALVHGAAEFAVSRIDDRDWVAQVRRELHPVTAGRFVVHGGHDAHRIPPGRIGLRIEAAMAFGTGHHGTTRGCLVLLDRLARRDWRARNAADIGCGTGVLAMAAGRLWRTRTIASDIDPLAATTARENMDANGIAPVVRVLWAPGFHAPELRRLAPFDLVFANILAAPLKRLAPDMAAHLAPGGFAILSGLLRHQAVGVSRVYRGHNLVPVDRVTIGEWTSLLLRRLASRSG